MDILCLKSNQFRAYTTWLLNIAMENGPCVDDCPSYKPPFSSGIFHGYRHWNGEGFRRMLYGTYAHT